MDNTKALAIVTALANGLNPETGEEFEVDSPYQALDVIRALFIAMRALEVASRAKARMSRKRMPANSGKPWTEDEDSKLLEQFDAGQTVTQLATAHERTLAGIQARLERHGRMQGLGLQWRGRSEKAPTVATTGALSKA